MSGREETPLVSVVIPSHDTAHLARGAVESVLRQTMPDWEVVLVDDGSGSESAAALDALARRDRVRLLRQESRGPMPARRLGWEHSRGELIAFLDDDDRYDPHYLERCTAALRERSEAGAVYTAYHFVTPSGERIRRLPGVGHSGWIFAQEVRKGRVKMSTLMVRRRCLLELPDLADFRTSSEYDLVLRLCHRHPFRYVDAALVDVVDRPGSASKDRSRRHRNRAAILENLLRTLPDLEPAERRALRDKIAKYYVKAGEHDARAGRQREARDLFRRSLATRFTARGLRSYLRSGLP